MYTTIIHPLRKAYNLSLNEYCVLDTIYHLSNNEQFWWWCIKSKANIADDLDLTARSVFKIINTLIDKWLIKKHPQTKHLRPNDEWSENIANKDKWSIAWKNTFYLSKEHTVCKNDIDYEKSSHYLWKKFTPTYEKSSHNNNIDNNNIEKRKLSPCYEEEYINYLADDKNKDRISYLVIDVFLKLGYKPKESLVDFQKWVETRIAVKDFNIQQLQQLVNNFYDYWIEESVQKRAKKNWKSTFTNNFNFKQLPDR